MSIKDNFAYPKLMEFFERISEIPRGSGNEEAVADYIVSEAKCHGLEVIKDSANNVLVNVPATAGYEDQSAILLQGHLDMVCEKNNGVEHDFMKDGIKLIEKDGWIMADGTTLGADNGVAVALMLYLMDGGVAAHPAVQCLFTAMEEVGMYGAKAFDYSLIFAREMINLDGASPSIILCGCAGGVRTNVKFNVLSREPVPHKDLLKLTVRGLCGGHSGEDANKGRSNANKLMGYFLMTLLKSTENGIRLISINGGEKDNAIPREAEAMIACNAAECEAILPDIESNIKETLYADDRDFSLSVCRIEKLDRNAMTEEATERVICFINSLQNGIIEMNNNMAGMVEYSRNLGVAVTTDEYVEFSVSTRSAFEYRLDRAEREIEMLAKALGADEVSHHGRYPGWSYAEVSPLRDRYLEAHRRKYGSEAIITIVHAGLECGFIKKKFPIWI